MRPGDVVEVRSVYRGRIRWSFPWRVVANDGETLATYLGPHSIWLLWTEAWEFRCWYVQLQEPLVDRNGGIETTDHALDVLVEPDGTWRWKDEDDFAEAQALGALDDAKAAAIRAEGEHVIAAKPWPTGWEDWRP